MSTKAVMRFIVVRSGVVAQAARSKGHQPFSAGYGSGSFERGELEQNACRADERRKWRICRANAWLRCGEAEPTAHGVTAHFVRWGFAPHFGCAEMSLPIGCERLAPLAEDAL